MKDNFSRQSAHYAKYRPTYPVAFYDYINALVSHKACAWDCGTGNGQVAFELSKTFDCVLATDISEAQISQATRANNIVYSVQPAEKTDFADHQFDLVLAAQAIHWFDFDKFYAEVRRTGKPGALVCVVGYGRIEITESIDQLVLYYYRNILGTYWDAERKYIDENYLTIPFPFRELKAPSIVNIFQWSREQLIGYINTWSAVKHFVQQNQFNPIDQLQQELENHWNEGELKEVRFPLLLRVGRLEE
ncbi:MAG: methyltransferase domain-containing protein [Bacteroidetes bacterium]|nr:methyltransferase domain-containing protein [Bacteroidota bacterium]